LSIWWWSCWWPWIAAALSRTPEKRGKAGGSGDGGVDGIIKEDRLGLDAIYLQANR